MVKSWVSCTSTATGVTTIFKKWGLCTNDCNKIQCMTSVMRKVPTSHISGWSNQKRLPRDDTLFLKDGQDFDFSVWGTYILGKGNENSKALDTERWRVFAENCKQYRRRQWHPTPVLLPGKSHGRRSLVGCRLWGRTESDTTERLHFYFSLSCIGEGNGNPLQYSCLENPRDGGAWWAAVYGVAQSWTRLKRLSSSSSKQYIPWFKEELNKRVQWMDVWANSMKKG